MCYTEKILWYRLLSWNTHIYSWGFLYMNPDIVCKYGFFYCLHIPSRISSKILRISFPVPEYLNIQLEGFCTWISILFANMFFSFSTCTLEGFLDIIWVPFFIIIEFLSILLNIHWRSLPYLFHNLLPSNLAHSLSKAFPKPINYPLNYTNLSTLCSLPGDGRRPLPHFIHQAPNLNLTILTLRTTFYHLPLTPTQPHTIYHNHQP